MKRNRWCWHRVWLTALFAVACGREARRDATGERLIALDVIVTVVNRTTWPVSVVVASDVTRHPLGDVPVGTTQSFSLPIAFVDAKPPVVLQAALGKTTVRSEAFTVQHGESIVWTISGAGRSTIVRH